MRFSGGIISQEIKDLAIADIVLSTAFTILLLHGVQAGGSLLSQVLYVFPVAFIAVSLSFVLHELMHKFVAQHFGAAAAFKRSDNGLIIGLIMSFVGFFFAMPGATMIYAPHFTKREEGYVSVAGPLTNFVIFFIVFSLNLYLKPSVYGFLFFAFQVIMVISIVLAFFNMLPVYPLDGSKVLRWNRAVYAVMAIVTFAFLAIALGPVNAVIDLIFFTIYALLFSSFYRSIIF